MMGFSKEGLGNMVSVGLEMGWNFWFWILHIWASSSHCFSALCVRECLFDASPLLCLLFFHFRPWTNWELHKPFLWYVRVVQETKSCCIRFLYLCCFSSQQLVKWALSSKVLVNLVLKRKKLEVVFEFACLGSKIPESWSNTLLKSRQAGYRNHFCTYFSEFWYDIFPCFLVIWFVIIM